ncbi:MAG TPA: hypothetical protein VF483_02575, partial [Gemmatimonadaceae bacterium]
QPAVALDSLGVGQTRTYFAKAMDASNKVIGEATGFAWSSSTPAVASVNATTGVTTALSVNTTYIRATLDGKSDSVKLAVLTVMPPGSVKSKVTSAADGTPQSGVSVVSGPNSTTTAADGSFTLSGLQSGDSVVLTKTGFVSTIAYNVPAFPGKTLEVPAISLSPTGGANGTVTGKVVNGLTGSVVSGITVKLFKGINAAPGPKHNAAPDITGTTDVNGVYSLSLAPGSYTALYGATGYSDSFGGATVVSGTQKTLNDALVAPTSTGGGIYIVVTWGDCSVPSNNVPCDLDAHLTGPKIAPDDTTQRFQVYHGNLRYVVGPDTIAALDVDKSNGRGPEIIGLRPSAPAPRTVAERYHFYVHNATAGLSANMALADSASARVDVYQDNILIGTFFPPAGVSGNVWNVFDYDGARLLPVGTITTESTPGVLNLRATVEKKRRQ